MKSVHFSGYQSLKFEYRTFPNFAKQNFGGFDMNYGNAFISGREKRASQPEAVYFSLGRKASRQSGQHIPKILLKVPAQETLNAPVCGESTETRPPSAEDNSVRSPCLNGVHEAKAPQHFSQEEAAGRK
jgi:hypothetical protein